MDRPWVPDELGYAGEEHLDPGYVSGYDRKQQFDPADDVAILQALGMGRSSALVDLGAGTGTLAFAAAAVLRHVTAVDISPVMVAALRQRAEDDRIDNVDIVCAGYLSYEHAGPQPDAVYTRNALHHLPDFWKSIALERIAGLLPSGGVLLIRDLVYDFLPSQADEYLDHWIDGGVDDPAMGYTREDLIEHIRTECSTYRWLFEPLVAAAGFEVIEARFRRSVYASYTCRKL
ncbi:MAG: class I SAM-dependent methyltransferase [Acidimicrobiia bacterium]